MNGTAATINGTSVQYLDKRKKFVITRSKMTLFKPRVENILEKLYILENIGLGWLDTSVSTK